MLYEVSSSPEFVRWLSQIVVTNNIIITGHVTEREPSQDALYAHARRDGDASPPRRAPSTSTAPGTAAAHVRVQSMVAVMGFFKGFSPVENSVRFGT